MSNSIYITPDQVCNLGRVPFSKSVNPYVITCNQILKNKNIPFRDTFLFKYFRQKKQPQCLSEFYGVECRTLERYDSTAIFLPWLHSKPIQDQKDLTFFGTREDLEIEYIVNKLKNIINSVLSNGYNPEQFNDRKMGHITGYFLKYKSLKKFYVVSGNHRASVLSSIDQNYKIPILIEKCEFFKEKDKVNNIIYKNHCTYRAFFKGRKRLFPDTFNGDNVSEWPSVKYGFIDEEVALEILSKYLKKENL